MRAAHLTALEKPPGFEVWCGGLRGKHFLLPGRTHSVACRRPLLSGYATRARCMAPQLLPAAAGFVDLPTLPPSCQQPTHQCSRCTAQQAKGMPQPAARRNMRTCVSVGLSQEGISTFSQSSPSTCNREGMGGFGAGCFPEEARIGTAFRRVPSTASTAG